MTRPLSCLILLCLIPALLWATAPTFDAASSGTGTDDFSYNHTATGSNLLMLTGTCIASMADTASVTYNSVSMTEIANDTQSGLIHLQVFKLVAPATGTHSVDVTTSSSGNNASSVTVTYSGVNQATPLGTVATGKGSTSTPSISVTSASGETVVDFLCTSQNITATAGAGQTARKTQANSQSSSGTSEEAGAGTVTMSWTDTLNDWISAGVGLKATSSGVVIFNYYRQGL